MTTNRNWDELRVATLALSRLHGCGATNTEMRDIIGDAIVYFEVPGNPEEEAVLSFLSAAYDALGDY